MANETKAKEAASQDKGKELQKAPVRAPSPFEEMDRNMQRMSEGLIPRGWLRRMRWEWPEWPGLPDMPAPRVDVVDREADVLVRAEVPGVDKKDLDISVGEDTVTIKGTTKREEKEEKGEYYRHEISETSFTRTVALPAEVDGTRATASSRDGVVELVIPKVTKSKRHSIKVD
jgi:HSP20 family protein